jgi:Sugar efflux transporter for intercellular exchange
VLWTVYGVHLRDPVVMTANLVSLAILIAALLLYFRFFKKNNTEN